MSKLKVLELFGGIGACSKALERLGIDYEIADYVEIDKYAVKSFNAIHNTNFEPQDICKWDKDIEVDLIMHGSPCQDFSLAGKQAGGDKDSGTRSSLMYETIRIVEKLKPKYVIWENVRNLLSKKHIHNFNAYLETLENLGYSNFYQLLNAKDYGIPQKRERVFTISILGNEKYNFPSKQELKLKLKDMLEEEVSEKYYLTDSMISYLENGKYQSSKVSSKLKQTETGICPTLDTMQGGNRQPFVKVEKGIRKLTPKECWRLMGFADENFERAEEVNSNTQLYKQAGNSIVVNVLEAILKNLLSETDEDVPKGQLDIYDLLNASNSKKEVMMTEKILNEIYDFCEECQSRECCPEEECVLSRIEQIALGKKEKYQVIITETLQRVIEVEAENEQEAIFMVDDQYREEKIVLDAADFIDYEISIFESDANEE